MSVSNQLTQFLGLFVIVHVAFSANINHAASPASSTGLFAAELLQKITKEKSSENVIFSPLSIQSALAMVFLGASGSTAKELKNGLHLQPTDSVDQVGASFAQILNQNSGRAKLNIANRIFVNSDYELRPEFNERSKTYFNSEAEKLNFKEDASKAIATINSWVEQKTNRKIKNLMQPDSVDANTAAVIVNAIYFKGRWETPFDMSDTEKRPFWNTQDESVNVDTMYASEFFQYGDFPELDAIGIEMPYSSSNISMLLLLPKQRNGLASMESKMSSISLIELGSKMSSRKVDINLPKFKIEFSIELTNVLKEMGIRSLFEDAELPGIFESSQDVSVSEVQHKAYIEVNEAGSEAAASSTDQIYAMSLGRDFTADHPFLFAIKSAEAVYFVGHVAKL